eukprot:TRINITY_DN6238_c0_g1_i1.p1 TRINITY_DN6238_c0_g1~~TRINITY_DN6238_c0_g1_i1.p1  ORF type:complete len:128 (-),score=1.01 TRINITY_DN6238_c0_g1_i1:135-482(-)
MSLASAAQGLRRELQQQRARQLYRRSLKNALSWAIFRDLWYDEADKIRAEFESHRHETNPDRIDRLLEAGEAKLQSNIHPDPYIIPWVYGGSKYARNPPLPSEIGLVYGFGKEEH